MIKLKSERLSVVRIKKKTRAAMFKDVEIGDELELSIVVKPAGLGSGGSHASYIKVENLTRGGCTHKSFNQLPMLLGNLELKSTGHRGDESL